MADLLEQAEVDAGADAARRERFPAGAAIAFSDLEDAGGEAALDRLRDAEPVSWLPALGGWLVTGHAQARAALSPRAATTVEAEQNLVRASLGRMMLTSDAGEHTRMRAPFERPFRMREATELFGAAVADTAAELAAAVAPAGECELGAEFAAPYAIRMAGRMLGLSLGDAGRIDAFYDAFAGAMSYDGNPEPQRLADAARDELNAILHAELERCRADPDASITSQVANDPAAGLADPEIAAQLRVIMFGAIETIQGAVMNTMLLLLRNPGAPAAARDDPAALAGAVDEALRMIPPVAFMERWTRAPIDIGGVTIGAGEFVGVSVIAANRDPAVFPDPYRFDPARGNARHALSFSFGEHHCLGAHLARLETVTAVGRLLEALPGVRLTEVDEPSGFAFRRPQRLRLAWTV
ncbi:MAG TPA: cytochrome P450 [Gaiellales bacterium]|nr:cytochrome P450 [Gaiellales bacterium]